MKQGALLVETLPAPVSASVALTPAQSLELAELNAVLVAGDGVLRIARPAPGGRPLGRALTFVRITAAVERVVLGASQPGFAAELRASDSALLTDLVVIEEARGNGVGTRLVEDALALARQHGRARLMLEVRRDNLPACRIYHRLGFSMLGDGEIVWCRREV